MTADKIYLVGFMAAGKTTVARALAARLGWRAEDIERVHLPMHGLADSLNVSVAAAILLYEARRQRGAPRRPPGRNVPQD